MKTAKGKKISTASQLISISLSLSLALATPTASAGGGKLGQWLSRLVGGGNNQQTLDLADGATDGSGPYANRNFDPDGPRIVNQPRFPDEPKDYRFFMEQPGSTDYTKRAAMTGEYAKFTTRSAEINDLIRTFASGRGKNLAMVAEDGVEPETLLQGLAHAITHNPDRVGDALADTRVVSIDVGQVWATKSQDDFRKWFTELTEKLEEPGNENVIINLENLELIARGKDGDIRVIDSIYSYLRRRDKHGKITTQLTPDEWKSMEGARSNLANFFPKRLFDPPNEKEAYVILKQRVEERMAEMQVRFPVKHLVSAIRMAGQYSGSLKLPGAAMDLIDEVMDAVKAGRTGVEPKILDQLERTVTELTDRLESVKLEVGPTYRLREKNIARDLAKEKKKLKDLREAYENSKPHRAEAFEFSRYVDGTTANIKHHLRQFKAADEALEAGEESVGHGVDADAVRRALEPIGAYLDDASREFVNPQTLNEDLLAESQDLLRQFLDEPNALLQGDPAALLNYERLASSLDSLLAKERARFATDYQIPLYDDVDEATLVATAARLYNRTEDAIRSGEGSTLKSFLDRLRDGLYSNVAGQRRVLDALIRNEARMRIGAHGEIGAKGIFGLYGRPGTGKTFITKMFIRFSGAKMIRYNGSEYTLQHEVAKIKGAPPGYAGHDTGAGKTLWDQIREANEKGEEIVIFLDDAHLAHPDFGNLLFSLRNEQTMVDNYGNTIDCSNVTVVIASNTLQENAEDILQATEGLTPERAMAYMQEQLTAADRSRNSPELVSGFTHIEVFGKPPAEMFDMMITSKWKEWLRNLENSEHFNNTIELSAGSIAFIQKHFKGSNGRDLERFLSRLFTDALVDLQLSKTIPDGSYAEFDIVETEGGDIAELIVRVITQEDGVEIVEETTRIVKGADGEDIIEEIPEAERTFSIRPVSEDSFEEGLTRELTGFANDTARQILDENFERLFKESGVIESGFVKEQIDMFVELFAQSADDVAAGTPDVTQPTAEFVADQVVNFIENRILTELSEAVAENGGEGLRTIEDYQEAINAWVIARTTDQALATETTDEINSHLEMILQAFTSARGAQ
ncbi:MAG: AAA family ATPase [Pseudomonadota bacterium]